MKEKQNETEKIVMIHHEKLIDFEENPFKVTFDEKMNELIGSIKDNGVLTPVIVRQIDNANYEILSGQRRVAACRLLNIDLIPAIVKNISYTDAAIFGNVFTHIVYIVFYFGLLHNYRAIDIFNFITVFIYEIYGMS